MAQDSLHHDPGRTPPRQGGHGSAAEGWTVLSHLLTGFLVFGLAGWGLDQLAETRWFLLIGLLLGGAASFSLIYIRYVYIPPTHSLDPVDPPARRIGRSSTGDLVVVDAGTGPAGAPGPPMPAEGFMAPSSSDFDIPPIFEGVPVLEWIDKPVIQLIFSVALIYAFFAVATRRPALVPGRVQYAAEQFQGMVRDSIARDNIGPEFRKYVPYLVTLFAFLLVNNLFGIIPLIQFPTFSHPGMAYALAILTWLIYNIVGIRKQGFGGYVRLMTWPPGVPKAVRFILTPIEFLSNFILRPITLSFRLFGNMFAGHLLLLVFIFGAEYMLVFADSVLLKVMSPFAAIMAIVFTGFEAFIQLIQAYIFTILTASYIGASLADEH